MQQSIRWVAAIVIAFLLGACGPGAKGAVTMPTGPRETPASAANPNKLVAAPVKSSPPPELELEALRIRVVPGGNADNLEVYDARTLLDRGNQALTDGRYGDALQIYDRLVAEFPRSSLVSVTHYNAGQALEGKANWNAAIARYRRAAKSAEAADARRDAVDAHLRIAVLLSELRRWQQSATTLEELLGHTDLTPSDRIEAMARLGYVLIEQKAYVRSEQLLSEAVSYYSRVSQTADLETNYFVAMSYYYLANIPHRQARDVVLHVTGTEDEQLTRDLSAKRKLLALAYERYIVALQRRHPYWATASGYQMSQMFKEFWDDVVASPIPASLTPREAGFYRAALHKYMRAFLEKAMYGHTKNVELAEAYRTATEWSRASETRAKAIAELLSREARGQLAPAGTSRPMLEPARDAARPGRDRYIPARAEL